MIDVKKPLRKAYYDLLNGALIYNGNPVPVGDDLIDDNSEVYVILATQSGNDNGTFQTFDSVEAIDLDIVYKGGEFVNKNVVDNIADQILRLLFISPGNYGILQQPGVQINCITITGDKHLNLGQNSSDSVMRRIITLSQKVRQTGVGTAPDPPELFKSPITDEDFTTDRNYENSALRNLQYDLFLNDANVFLVEDVDYEKLVDGGFRVLLANFDATIDSFTIYIILK